eukprot:2843296-Amphidinium_carterae.1
MVDLSSGSRQTLRKQGETSNATLRLGFPQLFTSEPGRFDKYFGGILEHASPNNSCTKTLPCTSNILTLVNMIILVSFFGALAVTCPFW